MLYRIHHQYALTKPMARKLPLVTQTFGPRTPNSQLPFPILGPPRRRMMLDRGRGDRPGRIRHRRRSILEWGACGREIRSGRKSWSTNKQGKMRPPKATRPAEVVLDGASRHINRSDGMQDLAQSFAGLICGPLEPRAGRAN